MHVIKSLISVGFPALCVILAIGIGCTSGIIDSEPRGARDAGDSTVNTRDAGDSTVNTRDAGDSTVNTRDAGNSTIDANRDAKDSTIDANRDAKDSTIDANRDGSASCNPLGADSDGDGTADCQDGCPSDANKTNPGTCGCGTPETCNAEPIDYGMLYQKPLTPPACNAQDPTVKFIRSNSDWNDINSGTYRVFCVEPGDYRGRSQVTVTTDGTEQNPRWIRWFDPTSPADATPPWVHGAAKRAYAPRMRWNTAHHWRVSGITLDGKNSSNPQLYVEYSDYNVFHNILVERADKLVVIRYGSIGNTFQLSVFRNTPATGGDHPCFFSNLGGPNPESMRNNVLVSSELYNCTGDGWQLNNNAADLSDHRGTIIADNDFYVTKAYFSDGNGNQDDNGTHRCAENGVDIKHTLGNDHSAPIPEEDWTKILGNRFWNFGLIDTVCGGSGGSGPAIVLHEDTNGGSPEAQSRYILIQDNYFDGWDGIYTKGGVDHVTVHRNFFHDGRFAMRMQAGTNFEVYSNVFVNFDTAIKWVTGGAPGIVDSDLRDNLLVDAHNAEGFTGSSANDFNAYFGNSGPPASGAGPNSIIKPLSELHASKLCYTRRRLTAPETVCVDSVVPSMQSAHVGAGDPDMGSLPGYGVGNAKRSDASPSPKFDQDTRGLKRPSLPTIGPFEP